MQSISFNHSDRYRIQKRYFLYATILLSLPFAAALVFLSWGMQDSPVKPGQAIQFTPVSKAQIKNTVVQQYKMKGEELNSNLHKYYPQGKPF